MSQERTSAQADEPLSVLVGQMHATLIEILNQQNDRIARLEAGPDRSTLAAGGEPEGRRAAGQDTAGDDSGIKEQQPEPAHFNSDEFAMVMSVWPDPGQAILTNTSSKSPQRWYTVVPLPIILNSSNIMAYDHCHAVYGAIASTIFIGT
jgi:hypothetical protein